MQRTIVDVPQGSPEWFTARRGRVTASEFHTVMASGKGSSPSKTRRTYMFKLIGERITGECQESYTNAHMERGKAMEEEARAYYEMLNGPVEQVGFIQLGDEIGGSPDFLVGDSGMGEIKTKLPHLQLEVLLSGKVPSEHIHQIQGGLWVADREWCNFVSYWPGMKTFIKRVYRDPKMIAEIRVAVDAFIEELHETMEQYNAIGG